MPFLKASVNSLVSVFKEMNRHSRLYLLLPTLSFHGKVKVHRRSESRFKTSRSFQGECAHSLPYAPQTLSSNFLSFPLKHLCSHGVSSLADLVSFNNNTHSHQTPSFIPHSSISVFIVPLKHLRACQRSHTRSHILHLSYYTNRLIQAPDINLS